MIVDAEASERALAAQPILQFVSFEVLPIEGGSLRVSASGTYLNEGTLEFVADDVETVSASTVDEALAVIRRSLTSALQAHGREH
jgi:hypothetical protein